MIYNSKNVLTINQVADLFEQTSSTISNNITNNRDKFPEGNFIQISHKDTIQLIKEKGLLYEPSPNSSLNLPNDKTITKPTYDGTKGLTLITEKGFALLAKLSNSDLAWNIYILMVDSYFSKELKPIYQNPTLPEVQPIYKPESQIDSNTVLTRSEIIRKITNVDSHKDTQTRRRYNINRFEHNLLKSQCVLLTAEEFEKYVITNKGVHYGFSFIQDNWGLSELQAPLETWLDVLKDRL